MTKRVQGLRSYAHLVITECQNVETFTRFVYCGLTMAIDCTRSLPVDTPDGLAVSISVIEHACSFIDTEQYGVGQVGCYLFCPVFAERVMVGQDAGIGNQPEPFYDL